MSFNPGQDGFGFNNETKSDTPSYQAPTFFKPNPTNEQQPQKPTFFNPSNIQNQSQEERKPMFFNPHGEEKNTTPTKQGPPPLMNTDSPSFFQPVTKSVAPPPLQGSFFKPTTTSSPVPTTQPSFNSTPTFTQPVDTLRQPENQELLVNRDKIDPQAIPSPGLHQYPECYKKQTYGTLSQNPPPNSNLRYSVVDEGICNPRFMRASTFHFPNSDALVKKTKMLVGVNIAPFSDLDPQDMPSIVPQVVHQGGPLRCARCRAYLNAFSQMQSTSRGYTCNFCSFVNDLPDWYQYEERDKIELKVGSVDFVATKEYCAKPPLPLSYIFVVDTNAPIQTIFSIIKSQNLNNENGFGIITFNKTLQFYSFGTNPQISIVGDVDDAFVPIPLNKLVIPGGKFSSYLEQVEKLVVEESGCCFGIALDVAREILSGGGRIVSFCAHLPDVGKGKVIPRDDKSYGTRNERDLFGPQEGFWKTLADACAKQQVSVDMFLFNNKFIEAATLGYVTTKTCGSLFLYRNDMSALRGDLTRVLTRDVVFDAVLKVRCSTGLSIKQYHGSFYQQTNDDIDLPGIDSDSNWFVELKHDAEIVSQVYLQCAVLYTSKAGQ
jgi:protein transport protein SEC24